MNDLVFTMATRGFAWNLIRDIFVMLDVIVYELYAMVMQLIFDVASVSGSEALRGFYNGIHSRIYSIIAIFMLFKITISLLNYLVNPDSLNDKERGIGKMVSRVIISLIMLIAFPNAFDLLYKVQPHLLQALPRVILGTEAVQSNLQQETGIDNDIGNQMNNIGKEMAFEIYNGVWFNTSCVDGEPGQYTYDNDGNKISTCFAYGNSVSKIPEVINLASEDDPSKYRYDYTPVIGMVVGVVISILMVSVCIDVSIRVFKLIILQLIAPIPILSYIDPKSSKDGAFSKWIKMVSSVYLEIFLKMGIIYFVVLVIRELVKSNVIGNLIIEIMGNSRENLVRGGLVLVALVVGLLFFAKDAPKFIADSLGIKSGENGKLFGGLGKIMAAGALGLGSIGAGVAAGRASRMADLENGIQGKNAFIRGLNRAKNIGAGLLGATSGLGAGYSALANAKDHHAKAVMDALAKKNATALAAGAAGSTAFGRASSTARGLFLGETLAAGGDRKIKALEEFNKSLGAIASRAKDEMVKYDWTQGAIGANVMDEHGNVISGASTNYKTFMAAKNAAAARGAKEFNFTAIDKNGKSFTATMSMEKANEQEGFISKNNEDNYIIRATNDIKDSQGNTIFAADRELNSLITDAEAKAVSVADEGVTKSYYSNGKFKVSGRSSVKSTQEAIGIEIRSEQRKNATNRANDRFSGKSS